MLGWLHKAMARSNPTGAVANAIGFSVRLADEMLKKGYPFDLVSDGLGIAVFSKGDPLRPFFNPSGNAFAIDRDCWIIGELSGIKKIPDLNDIVNVVQVDPDMVQVLLPVYRSLGGNILDDRFRNIVRPMAHMMAMEFSARGYI